jgi:hypothetical protein
MIAFKSYTLCNSLNFGGDIMLKKAVIVVMLLFLSACTSANEAKNTTAMQTEKNAVVTTASADKTEIITTTQTEINTIATTVSVTKNEIDSTVLPEENEPNYIEIKNKIGDYMDDFVNVYSSAYSDDFEIDDKIKKEITVDEAYGTNGVQITKYINSKDESIRYFFWFMGEWGQTEENIYKIENFYYVTTLSHRYSTYSVYVGDGDFLWSEFSEYIVINDDYFLIDRISESLVRIDENPISEYEKSYLD